VTQTIPEARPAAVIRADLVGSLMRPPELLAAREQLARGALEPQRVRELEDESIRAALARLADIGYPVATDGEMRRDAWMTGVSDVVEGFAGAYPVVAMKRPDGTTEEVELHTKPVVAKLHKTGRFTDREFGFLKANAGPLCPKITMPSPSYLARACFREGAGYATQEELLADMTEIVRSEVTALRDEAVRYVQLDEGFALLAMRSTWDALKSAGVDLRARLQQDIAAENACHDALAGHAVRAIHICVGNRTAYNHAVSGYDRMAEQVFNELHVDRFLLEYDSDRAGDFSPLRFMPEGKVAVLGLITTKDPRLEKPDDILRRIEEASRFCPVERLALSPQCGFYHGADDRTMTLDDQWRKLELVVEVAGRVWAQS
jgi:5-methyltetrahydropteroyltriglutamate--homocysteine methyltransferase